MLFRSSVALVLLLFGLVAFLAIAGTNLTTHIKENIGFDVIIDENAKPADIDKLKQHLNDAQYVSSIMYISKEDALKSWEEETGENLIEILGVNPLNAEFEVKVKANYASTDSLIIIGAQIEKFRAVETVKMQRDLVDSVNRNIGNIVIILGSIAIILAIISFALINNTVRLSVYSKRFLIHTMKLVGAKAGFIRKPFVVSNMINGLIAGIIADIILGFALYYASLVSDETMKFISNDDIIIVFASMLVIGMLLCAIAGFFAANKFIRLVYDSLFKR